MKEVKIGDFWDIDFCSKISVAPDNTFSSWTMYRDMSKVLTTKQHTNSRNLSFLFRPEVYLGAMLHSLELEQISSLIESIRGH